MLLQINFVCEQIANVYRTLRIHGRRQYREQTIRGKLEGGRGRRLSYTHAG